MPDIQHPKRVTCLCVCVCVYVCECVCVYVHVSVSAPVSIQPCSHVPLVISLGNGIASSVGVSDNPLNGFGVVTLASGVCVCLRVK